MTIQERAHRAINAGLGTAVQMGAIMWEIREAVAEEREAIARMADAAAEEECLYLFRNFAKEIRARATPPEQP